MVIKLGVDPQGVAAHSIPSLLIKTIGMALSPSDHYKPELRVTQRRSDGNPRTTEEVKGGSTYCGLLYVYHTRQQRR